LKVVERLSNKDENDFLILVKRVEMGKDLNTLYKELTDSLIKSDTFEVFKYIMKEDKKMFDCIYRYIEYSMLRDIVHPLRLIMNGENERRVALERVIKFFR
jgi:phosphate uptake regulator